MPISKGNKYISRRVLSSMFELIACLLNSVSLPTKCFKQAATFLDCTPFTYWTAILPLKNGSSEKLSKCLPPRGCLWILIVGPSNTSTSFAFASSPKASPSWLINSRSHVEPIEIAQGKQAEDFPEFESPLIPFGPSDILILGTFAWSILFVYQELNPLSSETFSSKLSWETNWSISVIG